MIAYLAAFRATAVLGGGRVPKVPFDEGCAVDKWYVVEVNYLCRVSWSVARRLIELLTCRCSSNFGCALVSLVLRT